MEAPRTARRRRCPCARSNARAYPPTHLSSPLASPPLSYRQVLDLGGGDMLLEIFGHIGCTFTLQRVAASCRTFRHLLRRGTAAAAPIWAAAWLTVPVMEETEEGGSHQLVTAAGALRRAPPGERIRLRAGTTLSGEVVCAQVRFAWPNSPLLLGATHLRASLTQRPRSLAQPVVLEAEEGCTLRGKLTLQAGTLNRSSLIGTVRGLKIAHFMEEAIQVRHRLLSSRDPPTRPSSVGGPQPSHRSCSPRSSSPPSRSTAARGRSQTARSSPREAAAAAPSRSAPPPPSPSATEPLCS